MRTYFREGKLPEPGTICEVERRMFPELDLVSHVGKRSETPVDEEQVVNKAQEEL